MLTLLFIIFKLVLAFYMFYILLYVVGGPLRDKRNTNQNKPK